MPKLVPNHMGMEGLADLSLQPNVIGDRWLSCDKARVVDGPVLRPWPGVIRVGERLWSETLHGPAEDAIHLIQFSQEYIRKMGGHGIAAVDASANTRGRVLGLAYHATGIKGTEMVGQPRRTTGSGLNDVTTRGVFTGAAARVYAFKITTAGTPDFFDFSNDGGATYSGSPVAITGDWQEIEDGVELKFGATTGHTLNNVFKSVVGGRPMYGAKMNRMHANHYVAMAGGEGKLLISNGVGPVLVSDGKEIRQAGIRPPRLKPTVLASTTRTSDIGGTEASPVDWEKATPEVTVTRITSAPTPPDGATAAVKIDIPSSLRRKRQDLAFNNVSGTVKGDVRRVRFWLYGDFERLKVVGLSFSLVFCANADLDGDRVEVTVRRGLFGKRWTQFDLAWRRTTDFAYSSIGLRLNRSLSRRVFTNDNLSVMLAKIELDGDGTTTGATIPSDTFLAGSFNRFAITWGIPEENMESGMSPFSSQIELDREAVVLECSGQAPSSPDGFYNVPPPRVTHVNIYWVNSATPTDSRTGGPDARRLTPPGGVPIPDLEAETSVGTVSGTATAEGNLEALSAENGAPSDTWTLTATAVPTVFSVSDGTLDYPDAEVNVPYDNGRVRFTIRQTGTFTTGLIFTFATLLATHADGRLTFDITDTLAAAEADSPFAPKHPFYNGLVPTGELMITDGSRVIVAKLPGVALQGGFTWTNGSYIIEPVNTGDAATQVVLDYWMEGRNLRRLGENKVYLILAYIEPNGTYPLGALFITGHFDEDEQEADEPYQGEDGDGVGILLSDDQGIWYTNVLGSIGPDIENVSGLNYLKVMPANDHIVGGGKDGEFVYILGAENLFVIRSRPGVLDDTPVSSDSAYMDPAHIQGIGMLAARTWFTRPDGSAGWIGPEGQLYIASQGVPQEHPVSSRLAAFINGTGLLTETRSLRYSWAEYKNDGTNEYLYIGLVSSERPEVSLGTAAGEPGTFFRMQETHAVQSRLDPRFPRTKYIDGQGGGWGGLIGIDVPAGQYATFKSKTAYNLKTDAWIENQESASPFTDADFLDSIDYAGAYLFHLALGGLDTAAAPGFTRISEWNGTTKEITLEAPIPGISTRLHSEPSGLYNFWAIIAQPQDVLFVPIDWSNENAGSDESTTEHDGWVHIGRAPVQGLEGRSEVSERQDFYKDWRCVFLDGDLAGWNGIVTKYDGATRRAYIKEGLDTFWPPNLSGDPTDYLDRPTRVVLISPSSEEIDAPAAIRQPFDFDPAIDCKDLVGRFQTGSLATDFELGLMVDMKRNHVYAATQCPFTTKGISPASSCTTAGQIPGPVFVGDWYGYLSILMEETAISWGSPSSLFIYPALASSPGGDSTFNLGVFYVGQTKGTFPTNPDGDSLLDGLMFAKVSRDRVVERRQIASNTGSQIAISGVWDRNPLPTDIGIVAPLEWMVQWSENRSSYLHTAKFVHMDVDEQTSPSAGGASYEPLIFWDIITGKQNEGQIGRNGTVRSTKKVTRREVQRTPNFKVKPAAARASSYRLRVLQGQTGRVSISNITAYEKVFRGEEGR